MPLTIVLDESSFAKGGSLVTAELWLDADGRAFPSARWSDFVVVIVGWWANALVELGDEPEVDWTFMDGPWSARLSVVDGGRIEARLLDGHGDATRELSRTTVARAALVEQLRTVGATVIAICERNDWRSGDLERLRDALARLE